MLGSKIGIERPLGRLWGHPGPKGQTRTCGGVSISKDLAGTAKLQTKLDPKRTKLGPNGAQVGHLIDLCLHLGVHVHPRIHQIPNRGPLDPEMLPKSAQHARAEGNEIRALRIRSTFSVSVPKCAWNPTCTHLGPIFQPSWAQVGAKKAQVSAKLAPSCPQEGPETAWKTITKQHKKTTPKKVIKVLAISRE